MDTSSSDLNRQILGVTLIPLFLLSVILTFYFIWTQTSDTQQSLMQKGHTIAKLVASQSNKAINENSTEQMAIISAVPLTLPDVADVVFLDARYNILKRSASFPLKLQHTAPSAYQDDSHWYYVRAVSKKNQRLSVHETQNENIHSREIIGWVIVLLSQENSEIRNQNAVFSVIAIIAGIFILAFLFARHFAKQMMTPISEITAVVEAFQKGNFDARARESHAGKLQSLASGINRMAIRIKVSTTDMETRVDSATRRLQSAMHHLEQQNETLESTKQKEVEANQAKDQFLARMSHELRTPLTSVLGFSKILQDTDTSEEQAEPIRIINHTSQLLLSIVDDILDYSKLQKDAISLERIDFNCETAMLDILEMQAPMAHSKGLELSLLSKNGPAYDIKGDPTRFKQIFSNLVSNAIKFTDTGSVAISADIQRISSHQSLIIISVTDTGIGISEEQLSQLFKAFVQADISITRRFGGSGLGLVIAKTLTQLMGGKLEIYSKQGRGTNVTLQIPALVNTENKPVIPLDLTPHKSILIYDDNPHTRRSIALMLERKNYNYRSLSKLEDLIKFIPNYDHLIIGIKATDVKNKLINTIVPLLNEHHKIVTFALPNGHPLPALSNVITVINKPIRPETLIPSQDSDKQNKEQITDKTNVNDKISVVVAEDNTFNQILIAKILEKHNIISHIASNGKEAIALIAMHQPDLAIIDIHMPVMDGFEATKIIRENSDMPIISLTANIIEQDHQKITLAGSNCIVLKPINDVELIKKIRELTHAATLKKHITQKDSDTEPPSSLTTRHEGTNIADYNLDQDVLKTELTRLLALLKEAFKQNDIELMRSVAHQMVGLAGLYELPEVELTTIELQSHLKSQNARNIWLCLSRLIRIINNEQQDDLES